MFPGVRKARMSWSEVSQSFSQPSCDKYWLMMFVVVLPDQPSSLFTLAPSGVGILDELSGRSDGLECML